jgi:MFS family permease
MAQLDARIDVRERPVAVATPARRGLVIAGSVLAGFVLTVVWSASLVDRTIGGNVSNTLLGHDAADTPIGGPLAGVAFAFVTGMAGSFTACNIAALGAVAPLIGERPTLRSRLRATLRPLAWLVGAMTAVSATYGAIVALVGTHMPQYSTATGGHGLSPRSIQSMVAFGVIGIVLTYLGLAALGVVKDPVARISERFPHARMAVMGVLIGGFLIGRPFGLYRQLFRDAADSHNPLYGAAAFVLQSVGNVVVVAILFLALAVVAGGRVHRWIAAKPGRMAVIVGASLIIAGVFTFLYWDVRLLARRDLIWYPVAPWSA